ncbi:MAG: HEPN domain-containing protein [Deltaproteobacteria bacterium]|nr:HEPN domain-containing protein [Deltaproteobacteria bacterium]
MYRKNSGKKAKQIASNLNIAAFHSQQAIDKSFKAVIEKFKINFIKTHNLITLYKIINEHIDFEVDLDTLIKINEIYIDSRYPSALGLLPYGKPTLKEAEKFFDFATNIHKKYPNY